MTDRDGRRINRRLDADDPLRDILDDPREAARRRLERRMSSQGEGSGARGGSSRKSSADASSASERKPAGRARRGGEDDFPESVDHADLLDAGAGSRSSRKSGRRRGSASRGISLPRPLVIAAGVVVLVALFAVVGALERSFAGSPETAVPVEVQNEGQEGQEGAQEEQPEPEQADLSKLPSGIDQGLEASLADLSASDERVAHAVNTIGDSGLPESEQIKMLELAVDDPQAIDFVAGLAGSYPSSAGGSYDDAVEQGKIPLLMQWDIRWGYTEFCGMSFASAGCCPTSLSMVYMGLTGKTDMTPYDMGKLATDGGYAVDGQGTIGSFLLDKASDLGLRCESVSVDASSLESYLGQGYVVICNVGPGDFTESGHFFVITGMDADGKLVVNDPYSSVRSAKTWDVDRVIGQTIALYAFKAA